MCYQGYGYPLMLFLEEGGVVTVCKINTQEPEETLDFDFCSTNVINKIILQSEGLREAFSELDMTSEVLQITMSPDKPYFRYLKAVQLQLSSLLHLPTYTFAQDAEFLLSRLLEFSELQRAFTLTSYFFRSGHQEDPGRLTHYLKLHRQCWFLEEQPSLLVHNLVVFSFLYYLLLQIGCIVRKIGLKLLEKVFVVYGISFSFLSSQYRMQKEIGVFYTWFIH